MIIVISNPEPHKNEHRIIGQLFDEGLEIFHIRRKEYPESGIRKFIEEIPEEDHSKIVLHSHYHLVQEYNLRGIHLPSYSVSNKGGGVFLPSPSERGRGVFLPSPLERGWGEDRHMSVSFHSLQEIENFQEKFSYGFLSPLFDSISKEGYKSRLDLNEVKEFLKSRKEKIIALGGIDEDKVERIRDLGFSGIALLGSVWQSEDPVRKFKRIREKWLQKALVY